MDLIVRALNCPSCKSALAVGHPRVSELRIVCHSQSERRFDITEHEVYDNQDRQLTLWFQRQDGTWGFLIENDGQIIGIGAAE